MKFYTGKGDRGKSYVCGRRIDKTSSEMDALASLDEANSLLGLMRSQKIPAWLKNIIKDIQEDLFIIQANIGVMMLGKKRRAPKFKKAKTEKLEKMIGELVREIKLQPKFVISGEGIGSGWLDFSRAVLRRAERDVLKLNKKKRIAPNILSYLNRLSSLLFVLARVSAKRAGKKEKHPSYL